MIPLLLAVVVIAAVVAIARNQRRRHALDAATVDLTADDDGVTRRLGDGRREHVLWSHVVEVEVLTVDHGVHAEHGAILVLAGEGDEGCLAPVPLATEIGVIERLHQLPAFDGQRLVDALQRRPPSRTTCWTRPRTHPTGEQT